MPEDRRLTETDGPRDFCGAQPVGSDLIGQSQNLGHDLRLSLFSALTA
jgi:hypothetical protein